MDAPVDAGHSWGMHDAGSGAGARPDPDATILDSAARHHGVVCRSQLVRAGVPAHAIDYRLQKGRLRRLHRGVYGMGPVPARYEREAAAVFACGDGAVLSHRTAAALWELTPAPARMAPVDVASSRRLRGPRHGVRLHLARGLSPDEIGHHHGLPLTTPARTLLDLAASVARVELERALARGERNRALTHDVIETLLARHPGRPGAPMLRALLRAPGGPALTRSEAESRFLELVRKASVPDPETNGMVEGLEVDFAWRTERLVVEIDGYAHHADRAAFERDRCRDGVLAAAGFRVIRVTWRQLTTEPAMVLVRLAQALTIGRRRGAFDEDGVAREAPSSPADEKVARGGGPRRRK